MGTLANSEDADEKLHIATLYQGMQRFARQNRCSVIVYTIFEKYNPLPLNIYNEPS